MWFLGPYVGGYAHRGLCEDAIGLFKEMLQLEKTEPNEAAVINVVGLMLVHPSKDMMTWLIALQIL